MARTLKNWHRSWRILPRPKRDSIILIFPTVLMAVGLYLSDTVGILDPIWAYFEITSLLLVLHYVWGKDQAAWEWHVSRVMYASAAAARALALAPFIIFPLTSPLPWATLLVATGEWIAIAFWGWKAWPHIFPPVFYLDGHIPSNDWGRLTANGL